MNRVFESNTPSDDDLSLQITQVGVVLLLNIPTQAYT